MRPCRRTFGQTMRLASRGSARTATAQKGHHGSGKQEDEADGDQANGPHERTIRIDEHGAKTHDQPPGDHKYAEEDRVTSDVFTHGGSEDRQGLGYPAKKVVELVGIEPTTSCMPCKRSPS
jgi:hypothetical protein